MDGQNRGIGIMFRSVLLLLWVVIAVVFYGTLCLFVAPISRRKARGFANIWSRQLLFLAGVKVVVEGLEKLDTGKRYVFISNHQSHIDIPVIIANLHNQLSFIAKKELFRIPFFGWGMYALGHIYIDRGNARKAHTSIKRAVERLNKDNVSLVLFPEGTRSKDGSIGQFKQGSFTLVKQAGVDVVPLTILNTSDILSKHTIRVSRGIVRLIIGDPVTVDDTLTKAEISELLRQRIQTAFNKHQ